MRIGCLLIHGWTGSSFEMEPLVEPLQGEGYLVRNILLPGHGTSFEDFCTTGWNDWAKHAEQEYEKLAAEVDRVVVVGLSMGGTLSMHLASKYDVAGVVALATPMYLYSFIPWEMKDWKLPFVPLVKRYLPQISLGRRSDEHLKISPWVGYDDFVSLEQLHQLMIGVKIVRNELSGVDCPVLISQDRRDKSVPLGNVLTIAKNVSSKDVTIKMLNITERKTGHHLITTHIETRETVVCLVKEFIKRLFIQNCK
ncbi:MAG: alpha/beta fold hydrolase [Desulfovibrionales bacterium]|nr:alpha/beta fold hydrolase [Desulfovibrionales bacterium]